MDSIKCFLQVLELSPKKSVFAKTKAMLSRISLCSEKNKFVLAKNKPVRAKKKKKFWRSPSLQIPGRTSRYPYLVSFIGPY